MGIGALALKALGWIGGVLGIIRRPAGRELLELMAGRYFGEKAGVYLKKLAELEAGIGANTELWRKLEEAESLNLGTTLTAEEVAYGMRFKKLWDKYVKRQLNKLPVKLEAQEPTGDTMETVEALKVLLEDDEDV